MAKLGYELRGPAPKSELSSATLCPSIPPYSSFIFHISEKWHHPKEGRKGGRKGKKDPGTIFTPHLSNPFQNWLLIAPVSDTWCLGFPRSSQGRVDYLRSMSQKEAGQEKGERATSSLCFIKSAATWVSAGRPLDKLWEMVQSTHPRVLVPQGQQSWSVYTLTPESHWLRGVAVSDLGHFLLLASKLSSLRERSSWAQMSILVVGSY